MISWLGIKMPNDRVTNQKAADILALACLILLTGAFVWRFVEHSFLPYEDAAMLMRYAENLSNGAGIVWNIGEPPLDGATDFLFMLAVASLHHLGPSLEDSVRSLTISSHFATVLLIYAAMRKMRGAGIFPSLLSSAYFAVGPGIFLSAAYFGTSVFALGAAVAWVLAQRIMFSGGGSSYAYLGFALVCWVVGLIRPEGVLICGFMLLSVWLLISVPEIRRLTLIYITVFLVLGGTYFG